MTIDPRGLPSRGNPPVLGDPAPLFSAKTVAGATVDIHVDAGRYVVLAFLGSPEVSDNTFDPKLGQFLRHAPLFRDDHMVFYGIVDARPPDGSAYRRMNRPALSFLADYDQSLARLYGVQNVPCTIVLDPMLRVIAYVPFDHPDGHVNIIGELLRALPPPGEHAGASISAPVLMVPRIFEFELCDFLMKYHEQAIGSDSGFLLDQNGVSRTVIDHTLKRRTDVSIDNPALMQQLRGRILRRLVPAIEQAFSFRPTRMDRCLLVRYSGASNDHFFRHRDNSNAAAVHRRFALTINLNGEDSAYDGGDLKFPEFGAKTHRPPSGGAIVFSCGLLHEVTPITRGDRFAFLAFLYGEEDARRRAGSNASIAAGERLYGGTDDLLDPQGVPAQAEPVAETQTIAGPDSEPEAENLVPVSALFSETGPIIEWLDFGTDDFTAPFFHQSIAQRLAAHPKAARRQTGVPTGAEESAVPGEGAPLDPAGFIFHMSKCGSTLVSRLLAAVPENLVLSEPDPINDVLGPGWSGASPVQKLEALHFLIRRLGRPRTAEQRRYFIKFSSWNALFLPLLLDGRARIPKTFIYRDPVEVMVSVIQDPPGWLALKSNPVAAGFLTGYAPSAIMGMSPEDYVARLLARLLRGAAARADESWLLINYSELPGAIGQRILPFFGIESSPDQAQRMRPLTAIHAKDASGSRPFTDDRAAKQKAASPAIRDAVERWLMAPYQQLEQIRLNRLAGNR